VTRDLGKQRHTRVQALEPQQIVERICRATFSQFPLTAKKVGRRVSRSARRLDAAFREKRKWSDPTFCRKHEQLAIGETLGAMEVLCEDAVHIDPCILSRDSSYGFLPFQKMPGDSAGFPGPR
jgi:hypothetical protein